MRFAVVVSTLIVLSSGASAATITGQVVGITDGDTMTVLVDERQVKVRLSEIDAPERKQPYGQRSRQALADLCHGVQAEISSTGKDRYGRVLGRVSCRGVDANAALVHDGYAWVFDRYVTDRSLYALQSIAKGARRGLWADKSAIPPWQWRKDRRRGNHRLGNR
jgi:endonuclease YncB( thermonuclease family)